MTHKKLLERNRKITDALKNGRKGHGPRAGARTQPTNRLPYRTGGDGEAAESDFHRVEG